MHKSKKNTPIEESQSLGPTQLTK